MGGFEGLRFRTGDGEREDRRGLGERVRERLAREVSVFSSSFFGFRAAFRSTGGSSPGGAGSLSGSVKLLGGSSTFFSSLFLSG